MLHEYYTDTTKHCEQEFKTMKASITFAKKLIDEKGLHEVKIITPYDTFIVRPPKKRKSQKQKENE